MDKREGVLVCAETGGMLDEEIFVCDGRIRPRTRLSLSNRHPTVSKVNLAKLTQHARRSLPLLSTSNRQTPQLYISFMPLLARISRRPMEDREHA